LSIGCKYFTLYRVKVFFFSFFCPRKARATRYQYCHLFCTPVPPAPPPPFDRCFLSWTTSRPPPTVRFLFYFIPCFPPSMFRTAFTKERAWFFHVILDRPQTVIVVPHPFFTTVPSFPPPLLLTVFSPSKWEPVQPSPFWCAQSQRTTGNKGQFPCLVLAGVFSVGILPILVDPCSAARDCAISFPPTPFLGSIGFVFVFVGPFGPFTCP